LIGSDGGADNSVGSRSSVFMFVPKGMYFEFTSDAATPVITWTSLVSGGAAPIDQEP
ncbi:unnamed protein product, partial [marine sediment metagenome]